MNTQTLNSGGVNGSSPLNRPCKECGEYIPEVRLRAIPDAEVCVPCLQQQGDVDRIKMLEEATRDDVVTTLFRRNQYAEEAIVRVMDMGRRNLLGNGS